MIRVILIDDEPLGLNTLKVLIERLALEVLVVATTNDPEKGIQLIESYRPDAVFLDVNMPTLSGFELLEKLVYRDFKLVFTTAHREHAIKAIKNNASDYLLKPIDSDELKACIETIINGSRKTELDQKPRSIIELAVNDGIIMIKQSNIIRLEASGSYTNIFLKDGIKHIASKNLKYFEAILDLAGFYRCHQSHIINLNEVVKLLSSDGYFALMSDKSKADVGKNYKDGFLSKLKTI
ncbi:MAG: LytTR family DNA-binding domain-containing protein [Bacteroidota bacterium]|nr:LytTR family DNA-binding domain-containing protein [Bacteroidota bacterium]